MGEGELGAWYDALDADGKRSALDSAARVVALEQYPLYSAQFNTDAKCAAALDELLLGMTEAELAAAYDRFVDDGSTRSSYEENLVRLGVADPDSPDYIPSNNQGITSYPDEIYAEQKRLFEEDLKSTTGYSNMAFNQSRKQAAKKIEV